MSYKVTKLDKRHSGNHVFKYYIEPALSWSFSTHGANPNVDELKKWRDWAWATYGPGVERDWAWRYKDELKWGWNTEHNQLRLYLKGDEELMFFKLSF